MISIDGQFLLKLKIGNNEDFLDEPQFINFKIIEEAGNILPIFELTFTTNNEDIIAELNEGNILEASIGKDIDSLTDIELKISNLEVIKCGDNDEMNVLSGFMNKTSYLNDQKTQIISQTSGVEALEEVVGTHFRTDFNISKSQDKMNWIQPYITDKQFANQLWLHSYISGSFLASSITIENEFRLRDIKKAIPTGIQSFDYKFTTQPENENDYSFDGTPVKTIRSGFINMWSGYGVEKQLQDLTTGEESFVEEEVETILALSNNLTRDAEKSKQRASLDHLSDNVDPNYWNAYIRNLQHLAVFNTVEFRLDFSDVYIPVKTLDIVSFKEPRLGGISFANDYTSGLYIVTKVTRQIKDRKLHTVVRIAREALNEIKGDLS